MNEKNTNLKAIIDTASGREEAELVLKNCNIVNVFSHEIIKGDIAINCGKIVGIGSYKGKKEIDMQWKYASPGLIDSHVHIESSMVTPEEFARSVVPRGTTTVIADPHEIANVCGLDGINFMIDSSKNVPMNIFFMLPSCVPATPFENSGAVLDANKLKQLIDHDKVLGLGELMDYPAVISNKDYVLDKIELAKNKIIDGHAPNLSNKNLNVYKAAGVHTDHECSTISEMKERLQLGFYVQIREGSAAKNLEALAKGITTENSRRCTFCTDDRNPSDILNHGHIDNNVRLAIKNGIDPITAIQISTLNASECYNLENIGALAPGYDADIIIADNLKDFNILKVYKNGQLVAENKKALFSNKKDNPSKVTHTVNMKKFDKNSLKIKLNSDTANIISLLPHSLITKKVIGKVNIDEQGYFKFNKDLDLLKLAVIERHNKTGNIGLGLVENFQLKNGAIASTVGHDSHNLIVIGDNDEDMYTAINELDKVEGGITISSNGQIMKTLPLPIAGLISDLSMEEVDKTLQEMHKIAYHKLCVNKTMDPFMTLAFLALPVIPEIKLTDMGLFDVVKFDFIDIPANKAHYSK